MLTTLGGVPGLGLVRIQLLDATGFQGGFQGLGHIVGNRRVTAFAAGYGEAPGDAVAVALGQALAQQRTITRGQAIGGCQRPFAGFGAGSEGERHARNCRSKEGHGSTNGSQPVRPLCAAG
ncbi:hypothetical protein D9M71_662280 [compost metagenome]